MFMGYRGEGAMNSLFNSETLYADIGTYLYVLSKGLVGYTFVALIILFIVLDVRKKVQL